MLQEYTEAAHTAMMELLRKAATQPGDIVVVGCSTSEVAGRTIGTAPVPDIAAALLRGLAPPLQERGLFLAAQCCEHLERALVIPAEAIKLHGLTRVNAIPQPKAGGSFATAAYQLLENPVLVRNVQAVAGIDIGSTLIGMHLQPVVVPVRLSLNSIGHATLVAARTRPCFVGGSRAVYDEKLL